MGQLFVDSKAPTHGASDNGVMIELDGDVPRLDDLPLVSHTNGDEVWGMLIQKPRGHSNAGSVYGGGWRKVEGLATRLCTSSCVSMTVGGPPLPLLRRPPCLPLTRGRGGGTSPSSPLTVESLSASCMMRRRCWAERTVGGSCNSGRARRAASMTPSSARSTSGP